MLRSQFLASFSLSLLLFTHCSWLDSNDDYEFSHAYVMPSCGPTDGPAFDVIVTAGRVGCGGLPEDFVGRTPQQSFIRISVLGTSMPEVPSTARVGSAAPQADYEGASARRCLKGGDCVTATGGSILFGRGARKGDVSISIELNFAGFHSQPEPSHVSREFRLRTCERQGLCG